MRTWQNGYVVGVDSAKDRVDLVVLRHGVYFDHRSIDADEGLTRGESLTQMGGQMRDALGTIQLCSDRDVTEPGPIHVFIEENIVRGSMRVAVQLGQTVGMLLALPHRCETVTIQQWKLASVGNGGATKEAVRVGIVRRMPMTDALYGKRQDLFDATGVAIYGDALLRRR